jgi:hypothetical protein
VGPSVTEIIQLESFTRGRTAGRPEPEHHVPSEIVTDAVYVVYTTIPGTLAALRVAGVVSRAMGVPLRLIHFRTVPSPLPVDAPTGLSPIETAEFANQLRAERYDVSLHVYLCRDARAAIATSLRRGSIVAIGGNRSWWPTEGDRWKRWLEAAGHFVLFVDSVEHGGDVDA